MHDATNYTYPLQNFADASWFLEGAPFPCYNAGQACTGNYGVSTTTVWGMPRPGDAALVFIEGHGRVEVSHEEVCMGGNSYDPFQMCWDDDVESFVGEWDGISGVPSSKSGTRRVTWDVESRGGERKGNRCR
jgi:hypothetical protein